MPTSFRMARQAVLALGAVAIIALAAAAVSRTGVRGLVMVLRLEPFAVVGGLGMAAMAVATPFVVAALARPGRCPGCWWQHGAFRRSRWGGIGRSC